jgi:hypothetical protein
MSVIYTQGGGAASVPDATTTTSGKVRLATIAEAGGTSEAIAVTPAGLQAEISSLANGLIYRGSIDVANFGTTLANAELGDYYKISTGGTSGGVVYSVGDSIIVNADMGGTFSDAKLDRIDNVDPSTSDEITGNHNATNYTATNSDTLTTHLSGLDAKLGTLATVATSGAYADLSGTPTLATVATSGDYNDLLNAPALATVATSGDYNDLLNAPALATVATSGAYADLSGTPTLATVATSGDYNDLANKPSANDLNADHATPTNYTAGDVNIDDHLVGIDNALGLLAPLASPTFSGVPEAPTATAGTNTQQIATTAFVSAAVVAAGGLSNIVEDTSPQLGNPLDVNGHAITSATGSNGDVTLDPDGTGDIAIGADLIPDADGTHTIGSESARYVSTYSDLNGAIRFKAKNDQGVAINKGDVVYIHSVSGDVPTVKLAQANSASTMPAFGLAASGANDQAEVQIISFGNLTEYDTTTLSLSVGDTLYVSATNAGELTNTAPAGEANLIQNIGRVVRASATEGIIKVGGAGRSAATPNLNDGKIFLGDSNNRSVPTALSSIALSSFNDDLSYQPLDSGLTSIAGLTTSGDEIIYTDGADSYTTASITAAGRALLDDADAAAQRTTLGLATVASSGAYSDLSGTPSADDLLADHTAVNYTASNANIDGHLAGIDSALASVGGSTNPNIYATTSSSYSPSASDAPDLNVWYGASSTGNFTLTLPSILSVLTGTGATGSVVETFEMWVGRAVDGDIIINATDGIDGIGGASNTNVTTLTVSAGQWIKIVGWKSSATNGKYLIGDPQSAPVDSVNGATGPVVLSADDLNADHATPSNYTAADVNVDDHLIGIDTALGLRLQNLSEDASPQLGANLDLNGHDIVTTSNANLELAPDGTGVVNILGNTTGGNNQGAIRLNCEQNSHHVTIKSPTHTALSTGGSYSLTLPVNDGNANDVLQTDGSGVLSWVAQSGGGGSAHATVSPLTLSADYTISAPSAARIVYIFTSSADRVVNLPAASSVTSGTLIDIKSVSNVTFTITPNTGDSLDTVVNGTLAMNVQYSSVTLVCDTTNDAWYIV